MTAQSDKIMEIYTRLLQHFGPREWWPADNRLEVIIGAILTQAVSWKNVEKAIDSLKKAGIVSIDKILNISPDKLADLIKPALYHRQKARKLQEIMRFIEEEYEGNLDLMFRESLYILREKLLSIWGVGEETADSILLYAGSYTIFVVDTYTKRIFSRIGMVQENISYSEMQVFMETNVDRSLEVYNEYHALLVALGANYCKKKNPVCFTCPLLYLCKYSS